MTTIDKRIVSMEFDNRQFESGVDSSLKSIDSLKKGLDFSSSVKGLKELDTSMKMPSLPGLTEGIQAISDRFTALGVIGITALQRLTNAAIDAGVQITRALSVDPVKAGFDEYETKMNSIQTILTNTAQYGTTIDDVNKALAELNTYADKTIYNFGQMTDNLGKFTAQGLKLDQAVAVVQGMSNVAAGFGVDAQRMAGATYQMSQALQPGNYVQAMDWRSMEMAGMGGKMLQDALKGTAKEMGVVIGKGKNFRDTLDSGWLSTELFVRTMKKMAKDKSLLEAAQNVTTFTKLVDTMKESVGSGWAVTWENIFGNKNESTALWTSISNAFADVSGKSADARNKVLAFWKVNGGRQAVLEGIGYALMSISNILGPLENAFGKLFPPMTGQKLVEMSKAFRDLMKNFQVGEGTSKALGRTFSGVFAILDIGKQAIMAVVTGLFKMFGAVAPVGGSIVSITAIFGDWAVKLDEFIKKEGFFTKVMQGIANVVTFVAGVIKIAVSAITSWFGKLNGVNLGSVETLSKNVKAGLAPLTDTLNGAEQSLQGFIKFFTIFGQACKDTANDVVNVFKKVKDYVGGITWDDVLTGLSAGLFVNILSMVSKFFKAITKLTEGFAGVLEGAEGVLNGVKSSLEAWQKDLKAGILLKLAYSIGILSAAIYVLSKIDGNKLKTSLAAMGGLFSELLAGMYLLTKIDITGGVKDMITLGTGMVAMSIGVLILAKAMAAMQNLKWDQVAKGLVSVGALMGILVIANKSLSANAGDITKKGIGFILFATAINVLVKAVSAFGKLDTIVLVKGIASVSVLLTGLAVFLQKTDVNGMGLLKGAGILLLATSLYILSSAVKKFSEMNLEQTGKELLGIALVLTAIGAFIRATGSATGVIATAIGIGIMAGSLQLLATEVLKMAGLPYKPFLDGLLKMSMLLAAVGLSLKLMPTGILSSSIALIAVAGALVILSDVLQEIGKTPMVEIGKGLIAIGGALGVIALAMTSMSTSISGALALVVVTGALMMLAPVIQTLGSLSMDTIGKGLLTLAGAFTILGIAGLAATYVAPGLISLSIAIGALGIAVVIAGAGLALFAAGLASLAVSGAAGIAALSTVIMALIQLLPKIMDKLGTAMISIYQTMQRTLPYAQKTFEMFLIALITTVKNVAPKLIDTVIVMVTSLVESISREVPKMIDAGLKLILGLLKAIRDNIRPIVEAAVDIVLNFIKGIMSKVREITNAGIRLVIALVNGMAEALRGNNQPLIDAFKNLISAVIESGKNLLKTAISDFTAIGGYVVTGFINGMKGLVSGAADAAYGLGKTVLASSKEALGVHSPSLFFKEIGENLVKGLSLGIDNNAGKAAKSSEDMSKKVVKSSKDVVKKSNDAAKKAFDKAVEWIDERKYYNKLSLEQELAEWEKLQKKYKEGSEERKKIDREVYRVRNEIVKQQFERENAYIEDRKYYNQMGLSDELAAWKRVQLEYKVGTEERKKADREVYRVQKEVNDKRKELEDDYYAKTKEVKDKLVDDIKDLNSKYDEAVKSRTDSLYSAYGLFDKIEQPEAVNGNELITNLKGQVDAFKAWQHDLETLAKKGVSKDLIKELEEMGPSSAAQIDALSKLSESKLQKYVSLWQKKHAEAKTQALSELEDMRVDTQYQITRLQIQTAGQLDTLKKTWETSMNALGGVAVAATTKAVSDAVTAVKNEQPKWKAAGSDMVSGFAKGISENTSTAVTAAVKMAVSALQAAKKALGIKSPSREFAKIGMYANQGLAGGLKKYSNVAASASAGVGNTTIDTLKAAISKISEVINGDMDMNPTIRPVLDLSNIKSGSKAIGSLLGSGQGINVSVVANKAASIANNSGDQNGGNLINQQPTQPASISFTQNNYSPKPLSRLDIYRQTKNQFSALKGLVT